MLTFTHIYHAVTAPFEPFHAFGGRSLLLAVKADILAVTGHSGPLAMEYDPEAGDWLADDVARFSTQQLAPGTYAVTIDFLKEPAGQETIGRYNILSADLSQDLGLARVLVENADDERDRDQLYFPAERWGQLSRRIREGAYITQNGRVVRPTYPEDPETPLYVTGFGILDKEVPRA